MTLSKVVGDLQRLGIKKSRIESPARKFLGHLNNYDCYNPWKIRLGFFDLQY